MKKIVDNEDIESIKVDFLSLDEKLLGKDLKENLESKNPFTDLEEVGAVFSFLSHIDAVQNQKNIFLGKVENKPLNFKMELKNKNNEKINEYFFNNINLGEGNFTQGIEHLLSFGMAKEKGTLLQKLNKHLHIPNDLNLEKLKNYGYSTLETIKDISQSKILGDELSSFIDGFVKNAFSNNNKEQKK
ncbi:TPA: hypothetical protein R9111_001751, partial [Campylobacter upsaliensis]|nr:hypothetical protein [Campylobacter upsaliensis]